MERWASDSRGGVPCGGVDELASALSHARDGAPSLLASVACWPENRRACRTTGSMMKEENKLIGHGVLQKLEGKRGELARVFEDDQLGALLDRGCMLPFVAGS